VAIPGQAGVPQSAAGFFPDGPSPPQDTPPPKRSSSLPAPAPILATRSSPLIPL